MAFARPWRIRFAALPASLLVVFTTIAAAQQSAPASSSGGTKQMSPADLKAWNGIRQTVLSIDGKWFAYALAPNEGNASVILRSTGPDGKETKFAIGDPSGGRGGGGGPPPGLIVDGGGASLAISG